VIDANKTRRTDGTGKLHQPVNSNDPTIRPADDSRRPYVLPLCYLLFTGLVIFQLAKRTPPKVYQRLSRMQVLAENDTHIIRLFILLLILQGKKSIMFRN